MTENLTAAVIIPTYNRVEYVATCLEHLRGQTHPANEITVIDASPNTDTRLLVEQLFPEVQYLRNTKGAGSTATSRAIGFGATKSDIVVFLDDDAFAEPEWLEELLKPYSDADVGGVGGRALNGNPGEEHEGRGQIGMLLPNGTLTGNFAADPGRIIEVDHMLGANMSLRRCALEQVGGIRDYYPGTCLREETDPALRIKAAGWRLLHTPFAVVRHVAGPYAKGKRFDLRYVFFGQRNHVVLLMSTLGIKDQHFRRYVGQAGREVFAELSRAGKRVLTEHLGIWLAARTAMSGMARSAAVCIGLTVGFWAGLRARRLEQDRVSA